MMANASFFHLTDGFSCLKNEIKKEKKLYFTDFAYQKSNFFNGPC